MSTKGRTVIVELDHPNGERRHHEGVVGVGQNTSFPGFLQIIQDDGTRSFHRLDHVLGWRESPQGEAGELAIEEVP